MDPKNSVQLQMMMDDKGRFQLMGARFENGVKTDLNVHEIMALTCRIMDNVNVQMADAMKQAAKPAILLPNGPVMPGIRA